MRIPVSGGDLFVLEAGQGDAVLFVHGWSLDHRAFKPQFDALGKHCHVINFDRRGFGQSSAHPDLRLEVSDLIAIIDALAVGKVHLVGMSQGGRIAIRFAAEHADRLHSLTLQGAAVDEIHVEEAAGEKIPLQDYVTLARDGRLSDVIQQWLAHPMMSSDQDPDVQRRLDAMLATYSGSDLMTYDSDSYAWKSGILEKLRVLTVPTLLLTGEKESVARRQIASQLLEYLPNAREKVIANAGHLCNLTAPQTFNTSLWEFIRESH